MRAKVVHRVGLGTDLHRLEPGGPLRLGGVEVPADTHLAGHSDADVVLHALTDALLGAAGMPDIGERYPDTDPALKGADSRKLLAGVVDDIERAGFQVVNADLVIHAQRPKLSTFKPAIRAAIAEILRVDVGDVAVKAKTHEGVDAVGRCEAIACTAIVGLGAVGR
ncbi:MAG: 2-C-methyl-D-erythritol 2,4-cyclodiphosphate synthase [Planctomycetota bacterium]|nr:MAG: 2-C-methyl-D-erythritol 2,4-cyclodiphosphate synthase [Planctomycetota bacterium]